MSRIGNRVSLVLAGVLLWLGAMSSATAATVCELNTTAPQTLALPGEPFTILRDTDGCRYFVALAMGGNGRVAVVSVQDGHLALTGGEDSVLGVRGLALSPDGHLLVGAEGSAIGFYDADALRAGRPARLGIMDALVGGGGRGYGAIGTVFSQDGRFAFVSEESTRSIAVIDLAKAKASSYSSRGAVIGRIPAAAAPVGLALSPDGRTLYSVSENVAAAEWPGHCPAELGGARRGHHYGVLAAIDVASAETAPESAGMRVMPAGCNPVRVAVSPDGTRIDVAARGSDSLLMFDATAFSDAAAAGGKMYDVAVGKSPAGILDLGWLIVVANSARFTDENGTLSFIDPKTNAVIGTAKTAKFPRGLAVTPDENAVLVSNYASRMLLTVPIAALKPKPH